MMLVQTLVFRRSEDCWPGSTAGSWNTCCPESAPKIRAPNGSTR